MMGLIFARAQAWLHNTTMLVDEEKGQARRRAAPSAALGLIWGV